MVEQLIALKKSGSWDLVYIPAMKHPTDVGYARLKRKLMVLLRGRKHVIAKGFGEEYGIDYEETLHSWQMTTI